MLIYINFWADETLLHMEEFWDFGESSTRVCRHMDLTDMQTLLECLLA